VYIIRRDKEDNLFRELQESSLKMIREYSGNIWTDYNVHDPGITIMDHLHYALYELHYVNSFSFSDYLKDPSGLIDYTDYGLLPEEELFAPSIVTPSDYEKLITGTFKEVEACRIVLAEDHTYHIMVQVPYRFRSKELHEKIITLYHAHRNLCETLGKVEFVLSISDADTQYPEPECPRCKPEHIPPQPEYQVTPAYTSVQYDFPDNYGINRRGKPSGIASEHEARILQLKGYLLIFDYLMDHSYYQMNQIPRFFSFSSDYLEEKIADIKIEGIEELIDRQRKSTSSLQDENWFHQQKAYYLDMLDALYGEDTNLSADHCSENDPAEKKRKRMELIRMLPELNANRFQSFNILDNSTENIPAVNRMIASLLNHDPYAKEPITDMFTRFKLNLLTDAQFTDQYKNLFIFHPIIVNIEKVNGNKQPFDERRFRQFRRQIHILWYHVLFSSFMKYGGETEYYGMVWEEEKKGYLLLFRYPGIEQWINMGFFFEKETLITVANDLIKFIRLLNRCDNSFYLVEHILLSTGKKEEVHTLSVIVSLSNEKYSQRKSCESLLRERLPAHLHIRFLWLDQGKMYRFEHIYFHWREALAGKKQEEISRYSKELHAFLYNPS